MHWAPFHCEGWLRAGNNKRAGSLLLSLGAVRGVQEWLSTRAFVRVTCYKEEQETFLPLRGHKSKSGGECWFQLFLPRYLFPSEVGEDGELLLVLGSR